MQCCLHEQSYFKFLVNDDKFMKMVPLKLVTGISDLVARRLLNS